MQLDRKQDLNILNQVSVFGAGRKAKMTPLALISGDTFAVTRERGLYVDNIHLVIEILMNTFSSIKNNCQKVNLYLFVYC